jgi:ribosomal-protein-alanine N-acetyltransferase
VISLETERLILRNFRPEDWQELQELAIAYRASEWAQYEDPWPTSEQEVKGMAEWFASGDEYLAVCLKTTSKLIGLIAIGRRPRQEGRVHNLGYVFHPDHHGQGYAAEGCRTAMAYVFGPLEAEKMLTGTHPANERSAALLKRLGLQEIARGEFALSREEWLAHERKGQDDSIAPAEDA